MPKALALDANLLILLVVGLTKQEYVATHKRLKAYSVDDFNMLQSAVAQFSEIVVTPNVLTETSNLLESRSSKNESEKKISEKFQKMAGKLREIYVTSAVAGIRPEFLRLGLSDTALLEVNKSKITMLTADLQLYLAARKAGYKAYNFNHLREARWSAGLPFPD